MENLFPDAEFQKTNSILKTGFHLRVYHNHGKLGVPQPDKIDVYTDN